MRADSDRHGTRPGANRKRWVRPIGARAGFEVLILPGRTLGRTPIEGQHSEIYVATGTHSRAEWLETRTDNRQHDLLPFSDGGTRVDPDRGLSNPSRALTRH